MSHELRTPLNIVMGYTEMLLDRSVALVELERERLTRRIREAAGGLLQLVDNVLDLGKLETGQVPVSVQPILLGHFVARLRFRVYVPRAPEVALRWAVDDGLPRIQTDPGKLTIVLDNLINNAIKFTSHGSVTVSVRDLTDLERVEFTVSDTGPGIDAQHLRAIFRLFHQIAGSTAKQHGGVGLGLAIVESYVELLGGEVSVQSTLGSGSSFVVRLPYCWTPRHSSSETSPAPARPLPTDKLAEHSPID